MYQKRKEQVFLEKKTSPLSQIGPLELLYKINISSPLKVHNTMYISLWLFYIFKRSLRKYQMSYSPTRILL